MIGHNNEAVQEKWIELLYTVKTFNSFSCIGIVLKISLSLKCICCNKHESIILSRVPLRHVVGGYHLEQTTAAMEGCSAICMFFIL